MVSVRCDTLVPKQSCGLRMQSQLKFSWPLPWHCVFPLPQNIHSWFKPARFRFVWWLPWFSDQIIHFTWLCICFTGTEGGWHGRGHKQLGEQQCSFWSYTGLKSSLNCLTQPWWGCPELNLCKSYSCTHTELIWVLENSTERWHWWKCLCELASGRKEVLPLLEAAEVLYCLCDCERWSCCSDLRESHRLWGAVLSPTLREHPVEDMAGQRRSCSSVVCSLILI